MTTGISRRRVLAFGASAAAGAFAGFPAFCSCAEVLPSRDVTQPPFGAAGDGERDDTAAIQRAIDEAAQRGGGTVVLPPGRYLVSRPLRIDASNVHLAGTRGLSILTRKSATRYVDVGGPHRLRENDAIAALEKAPAGSRAIAVRPSVHSIAADSWVVLLSGPSSGNGKARRSAQFIHIAAAKSGRLELSAPLRIDCHPRAGDRIVPVDWLRGCRISGLAFEGTSEIVGQRLQQSNILTLHWCMEPVVQAVGAWNLPNLFISLEGCLSASVSDVTARDSRSTGFGDSERGYGYIVVERGLNEGARISRLVTQGVRHSYTTTDSPSRIGEPYGTRVSDSIATAPRGAGFDTHPAGENITFVKCHVVGSEHAGFQVRAKSCELIDCSAEKCEGPALLVHTTAADARVQGFISRATNSGSFRKIDWTMRGAILDRGVRTRIDGAQVSDCAGPGVDLERGDQPVYRMVRVHNPGRSGATPIVGFRLHGSRVTRFLLESCLVSSDSRRIDVAYFVDAPNLIEGVLRGCSAPGALQLMSGSRRVKIVEGSPERSSIGQSQCAVPQGNIRDNEKPASRQPAQGNALASLWRLE